MAQEEHSQRCGNISSTSCGGRGSNRSSKKLKQKKVPQRGLGVAQLEKIRLDEQQKKGAAIFPPNSLVSPKNSSCLVDVQCAPTNLRQSPSQFSIPLPPPQPADIFSPNPVFRPPSSISIVDSLHLNSVPLPNPSNGEGRGIGFPVIPGFGHDNWPVFWNSDNLEREIHRLNYNGFEVQSNTNAPYESNPIWPSPSLLQKAQKFQQPSSSPMVVNVSLGTSSSSVMEPPSNQSFYSNYYIPTWTDEEKMVGTKRPYPHPIDNQSGPSFPCKFPPTCIPPIARRDVSGQSVTRGTDNAEPSNPFLREAPSSSTEMPGLNPKTVARENGDMNGDFLTLAPPTTALSHPHLKHITSPELSEFESLPYQGNGEAPILETGPRGPTPPAWPFYRFFPSATQQNGQETAALSSWSDKVGENLDLNLKL